MCAACWTNQVVHICVGSFLQACLFFVVFLTFYLTPKCLNAKEGCLTSRWSSFGSDSSIISALISWRCPGEIWKNGVCYHQLVTTDVVDLRGLQTRKTDEKKAGDDAVLEVLDVLKLLGYTIFWGVAQEGIVFWMVSGCVDVRKWSRNECVFHLLHWDLSLPCFYMLVYNLLMYMFIPTYHNRLIAF